MFFICVIILSKEIKSTGQKTTPQQVRTVEGFVFYSAKISEHRLQIAVMLAHAMARKLFYKALKPIGKSKVEFLVLVLLYFTRLSNHKCNRFAGHQVLVH